MAPSAIQELAGWLERHPEYLHKGPTYEYSCGSIVMSVNQVKAWASARARYPVNMSHPEVLDKLIIWRMNDPRYTDRSNHVKGIAMQRMWTIEVKADFADPGKNEAIDDIVRTYAKQIHATVELIKDTQKPQVACFSDDWFCGHTDLDMHKVPSTEEIANLAANMEEAPVSDEMLQALREMRAEANEKPK